MAGHLKSDHFIQITCAILDISCDSRFGNMDGSSFCLYKGNCDPMWTMIAVSIQLTAAPPAGTNM